MNKLYILLCFFLFLALFVGAIVIIIRTWKGDRFFRLKVILAPVMIVSSFVVLFVCAGIVEEDNQKETYAKQIEIYETYKATGELNVDNCLILTKKGDTLFSFFLYKDVYNILFVKDGVLQTTDYKEWKKDVHKGKPTIAELRNLFGLDYSGSVTVYESDYSDLIPKNYFVYIFNNRG